MNEGAKPLMPLTLHDFYFHPPSAKNTIDIDSNYILVLHDNYIHLYVSNFSTFTSSDSSTHLVNADETNWDNVPLWAPYGGPLHLNLELSELDDPIKEFID